ncbi:MAG: DUF2182 domain-containing protein [Chloroflexi bacterium]|nr:DUF2182 domain-containing protein [Chloroflexota bacterium]
MPARPGTMGLDFGLFLVFWTLMMAAMMLPSVAPVASMYLTAVRRLTTGWPLVFRVGSFVVGYLVAWAAFGIPAFGIALLGGQLAASSPRIAPWVGAFLLVAAGIYQLTPLKDRCLSHCRSPLAWLFHFGNYTGPLRDMRAGLFHGGYCVGCCWGLMLVLIAVGVMNLAWMVGLAVVVFLEKTWRYGKALRIAIGFAFLGLALLVPWHPELLPGFYMSRGMGM